MSLDTYMPEFTIQEYHNILIDAPSSLVYETLYCIDFYESRVIRWLFKTRGIQIKKMNLEELQRVFPILHEEKNHEIVMGTTRKALDGDLCFVWNFKILESGGRSLLSTETRAQASGQMIHFLFGIYWAFVSNFSKWIRRIMLRMIKDRAEGKKYFQTRASA